MADPASWLLLEYLRDRVLLIRQDDGYYTDLGAGEVVIDDDLKDDTGDKPVTIIDVSTISPTTQSPGQTHSDIRATIEFAVPRGMDAITNPKRLLHRARADLVRCIKSAPKRALPDFLRAEVEIGDARLFADVDNAGNAFVIAQVDVRARLTELASPTP